MRTFAVKHHLSEVRASVYQLAYKHTSQKVQYNCKPTLNVPLEALTLPSSQHCRVYHTNTSPFVSAHHPLLCILPSFIFPPRQLLLSAGLLVVYSLSSCVCVYTCVHAYFLHVHTCMCLSACVCVHVYSPCPSLRCPRQWMGMASTMRSKSTEELG
jgi:hypothetical protein